MIANPPEIHVALLAVPDDAVAALYESFLDAEERVRMAPLKTPRARRLFAAAHGWLRLTLSRAAAAGGASIHPTAWRFLRDPGGRPRLAEPFDRFDFDFNLSHTDGLVAAAVAAAPGLRLGIDVESARGRERNFVELARRFWSESEADAIEEAPEGDMRRARFLALWTLKESRLKATGDGLSGGLKTPVFAPPAHADAPTRDGGRLHVEDVAAAPPEAGWRYRSLRVGDAHWAAVAARGTVEADWRIRWEQGEQGSQIE